MKELIIRITLYDLEDVSEEEVINIYDYIEGYFPNNRGISHVVKEITDYKKIFEFLKTYIEDLRSKDGK